MKPFPWQVVTHWVSQDGNPFVHTAAFASMEEARREEQRLGPLLGVSGNARTLKSIEVVADAASVSGPPAAQKAP